MLCFIMAKRKRKQSFVIEEVQILLDEVENQKKTLFNRFKGTLDSRKKKQAWEAISDKMAAVTGVARSGEEVRKKWQDFSSLAKRKAAGIRRDIASTGGGPQTSAPLTAEEERALSIMGSTACTGARGGIDVREGCTSGKGVDDHHRSPEETSPSPASPQEGSPCQTPPPEATPPQTLSSMPLGTTAPQQQLTTESIAPSTPPHSSHQHPSARPPLPTARQLPCSTTRQQSSRRPHPASTTQPRSTKSPQQTVKCTCSQDLVDLDREKLQVLKDIRGMVNDASERDARFQEQVLELKKAKLELEKAKVELEARRLLLAEQKFVRPALTVPVVWPEEGNVQSVRNRLLQKALH